MHFFHPEIKRKVYIELPEEDKTEGEDQVGVLLMAMYGTRDSSAEREGCFSELFGGGDTGTGLFSPCLCLQEQTKVKALCAATTWKVFVERHERWSRSSRIAC